MYTQTQAALQKKRADQPWRPSNGTEGDIFISNVCRACKRNEQECDIIGLSMAYNKDDPEYPDEWVYGDDGQPQCKSFDTHPVSNADKKYIAWLAEQQAPIKEDSNNPKPNPHQKGTCMGFYSR